MMMVQVALLSSYSNQQCRPRWRETKLDENGLQVPGDLGGNQALCHSRVGASDSNVVNLSAQKVDFVVHRPR
jgi:hypothetical protein